ncbi:hypothetical protein [Rhodoferax sp.]|uniref:hypothetical protein n=1 Tax=Rhodoferax sp. TaxID=50421 RepID=UPI00374D322E
MPRPTEEVVPEDWDLLFQAVLTRLRDSIDHNGIAASVRTSVLDCVQELEHLRRTAKR